MAWPKGKPRPPNSGRQKGTTNKATSDVRAAIATFASRHIGQMSQWLEEIKDPSRRLDLYLRALEYHVPKLGRTEHTGANGGPLRVNVVKFTDSGNPSP